MRGRKPKPGEVKRREGNARQHTPKITLVGGRRRPPMPAGLSKRAQTAWKAIVADLEAGGILDFADWPIVEAAAVAIGRAREARAMVNKEGLVIPGQKGNRTRHPALGIELEAWKEVRQLADHIGLSPAGRERLGMAGVKGKPLEEELAAGRGARRLAAVK